MRCPLAGGLELEALDGDAVAGRPNHASASKPGSSNSGGAAAPRWPGHRPARARRPLDSAGAASSVGAGGRAASPGPLEPRDAAATSSAAATEWGSSAATGVPLLTANGQAGKRENDGILDSILHRKNFLTQACAVRVMATLLLEAGAALGWSAATGKPLPHFGPEHVVILRTGGWDAMASTLMPEFEYEDSVAESKECRLVAPARRLALAREGLALALASFTAGGKPEHTGVQTAQAAVAAAADFEHRMQVVGSARLRPSTLRRSTVCDCTGPAILTLTDHRVCSGKAQPPAAAQASERRTGGRCAEAAMVFALGNILRSLLFVGARERRTHVPHPNRSTHELVERMRAPSALDRPSLGEVASHPLLSRAPKLVGLPTQAAFVRAVTDLAAGAADPNHLWWRSISFDAQLAGARPPVGKFGGRHKQAGTASGGAAASSMLEAARAAASFTYPWVQPTPGLPTSVSPPASRLPAPVETAATALAPSGPVGSDISGCFGSAAHSAERADSLPRESQASNACPWSGDLRTTSEAAGRPRTFSQKDNGSSSSSSSSNWWAAAGPAPSAAHSSGRADASAPVTPTALAGRADALSAPHGSGARFPPSTALLPSTASGRAEGLGWSDAEGAGLGTTQPQPSNPGDCQHGAASTFDLLGLAAEAGSTEVDEVDLREQHLYASGATTLSCVASDESMGVPAVMRATRVMDAADMGRAGSSSLGAQRADRDAAPQRLEAAIVAPNGGDSAAGKLPMCAPRKLGGKPSAEMPACQQRAAKRDRDRDRDLALLPVPVPQRSWGSWGQQGSSAFASSCFAEPQVTVDSWRPDGQISRPEATSLGTPPAVSHRGVSAATVPAEASSTLHGTGIDSEASGPPSLELRFHEQLEPTSDDEADEPASILLLSAQPFGISSFESDF